MAFCPSRISLHNSAHLSNNRSFGIDFTRHWNENVTVSVRGFGDFRESSVKKAVFSGPTRYNTSYVGTSKQKLETMCMLQPKQVELESTDPKVVILKQGGDVPLVNLNLKVSARGVNLDLDNGVGGGNSVNGNGGDGRFPPGGGGGGGDGGGDHEEDDKGEEEFGPLLKFEEVMREVQARGATLPSDMLQAAKTNGIRKLLLHRYLDLQASPWPLGMAMRSCSLLRNRMLADPAFLFKVGTEVVIDSCCATFAEVQKRGENFWAEFELFTADLLVGVVVDIALVGLLAPYTRFGQPSTSKGFFGGLQRSYAALPSSVFEAERPGCKFSTLQRVGTYFSKGVLYASVGFFCGIIGQGIANLIMTAKRSIKKSENDVPVPPLLKSAALWGVFLGVSSNTRYQIINGLECLVEASPLAKKVPPVAMAFTVGVRFANNVYGGMQFVDWARWSGVQ